MTARRHAFKRSTRAKGNKLWTTVLFDQVAMVTTGVDADILVPTDWERSATSFERATLLGIRGWISTAAQLDTASSLFLAVVKYDEDEASTLVDTVAAYDTEDILWTGGVMQGPVNINSNNRRDWEVVIKTHRRIESNTEIRLSSVATVNSHWDLTGVLRACVQYS